MKIIVKNDYTQLSEYAARTVADHIKGHPGTLLCFAAGDTPSGMFDELIAMQERGDVDLNAAYYVGLDEWVGLGGDTAGSCRQVMDDRYYLPAGIDRDRMRIFDGLADPEEQCREISAYVTAHGGIGLAVLGIGMNGHVGFNEPGSRVTGICGTVELDTVSLAVSPKYFGKTLPVRQGVTLSMGTLLAAGRVLLMASGGQKADIVGAAASGADEDIPASLFNRHPDATLLLDAAAAKHIAKE